METLFILEETRSEEGAVWEHPGILDIVICLNNYRQFKTRYRLFKNFIKKLSQYKNIRIHVGESILGDRIPFTRLDDPVFHSVLHFKTHQELWHKENIINIVVSQLPSNWKYMAWIDADIQFLNDKWVSDTIHALEHSDVVQLFQTCIDLGPTGNAITIHKSFAWMNLQKGFTDKLPNHLKYTFAHPGYAWAITRKAFERIGGLFEYGILGAGDHHMALAFIEKVEQSYPGNINENYKNKLKLFQKKCRGIRLGCVNGSIAHNFHGKKKDRKYIERWDILVKNDFKPDEHLTKDYQGLWKIEPCDDTYKLIKDLSLYFLQRNEDSIDED